VTRYRVAAVLVGPFEEVRFAAEALPATARVVATSAGVLVTLEQRRTAAAWSRRRVLASLRQQMLTLSDQFPAFEAPDGTA
jgi:hypothetical protein